MTSRSADFANDTSWPPSRDIEGQCDKVAVILLGVVGRIACGCVSLGTVERHCDKWGLPVNRAPIGTLRGLDEGILRQASTNQSDGRWVRNLL
jgi:hypothetical protein